MRRSCFSSDELKRLKSKNKKAKTNDKKDRKMNSFIFTVFSQLGDNLIKLFEG